MGGAGLCLAGQSYRTGGVDSENLEVALPGRSKCGEIVLIGAHYDPVKGSADDNASGAAALLEIGRAFVRLTPERSVRLVAFVNEEPPFVCSRVMGSMILRAGRAGAGDDIRLRVSIEMLGYCSQELQRGP